MFTTKNSSRDNQGLVPGLLYHIKTCVMATHHGCTGCSLDSGLEILTEDPKHTDIDNDSTHSSDATVAFGGPETVGHP